MLLIPVLVRVSCEAICHESLWNRTTDLLVAEPLWFVELWIESIAIHMHYTICQKREGSHGINEQCHLTFVTMTGK